MKRIYDLQLRILVSPHDRGFCAEAVEMEGYITAPTRQAAISGYLSGVQSVLHQGELIFRECPKDLLVRWVKAQSKPNSTNSESCCVVCLSATYPHEQEAAD